MVARKILVVDDSATDLKNMEQIIVGAGHKVISASGGTEGLAKAKAEKPDLIFLDIVKSVGADAGRHGFGRQTFHRGADHRATQEGSVILRRRNCLVCARA